MILGMISAENMKVFGKLIFEQRAEICIDYYLINLNYFGRCRIYLLKGISILFIMNYNLELAKFLEIHDVLSIHI